MNITKRFKFMLEDLWPILRVFLIAISVSALFLFRKTIFPFVGQDEYYEEKCRIDRNISYIVIHNANCPFHHSSWFKKKGSKYEILIKKDADFCPECFDEYEIKKLEILHKQNYRDLYLRYRSHYTKVKTDSLMSEYKYVK